MNKIYLGKVRKEVKSSQACHNPEGLCILGNDLFIEKHKWDCGWYWGFGYIGNKGLHTHAKLFVKDLIWHNPEEIFEWSIFKNAHEFWIFKDLLKQAYALKSAAEVYEYGGNCTTSEQTKVIESVDMAAKLNEDLSKVLDAMWAFLISLNGSQE